MRVIRRLAVPALVLALAALAVPAGATIWCDEFCCNSPCWRTCWTEDGPTTCQAFGSCMGSPDCTGFAANAKADLGETTSPLVCTDTASDAEVTTPVPAQATD